MCPSDKDLTRKLLVMKIQVTTAEILAVCHTHIAIADNMSSMGLVAEAVHAVQKTTKISFTKGHFSTCGNCTRHIMLQAETTAQQRTPLSQISEHWTLETEVQEVQEDSPRYQETYAPVTISMSNWRKKEGI